MAVPSREGEVLDGKYRILRKLGEGGMGAVYAGENIRVKKAVAIKILHAGASAVAEMADRFEREAQAAGQIGSDHIVEVYDLGVTESGERYMVMEYLDGEPLRTRIKRYGKLSPHDTCNLISQMLEGLDGAHRAGIIHRDLKPDNVFLCREKAGRRDFVKILDFGISKFTQTGEAGSMTRTGTVMGSPNYMSPEHVRSSNEVDAQSDIYSVGIMLFEALTGTVPRKAPTFAELLFKIVYEPMPDPRTLVPELPPALVDIVMKACSTQKEHRYRSALELRQALLDFASAEPRAAASAAAFGGAGASDGGQSTVALSPEMAAAALGPVPANLTPGSHPSFSASGSQPAFGGSQPAFGGSQPAFGGSQPSFGGQQAFAGGVPNASQPSFGRYTGPGSASGAWAAQSQPAVHATSQPSFGPGGVPAALAATAPQTPLGSSSQPNFGSGSQPNFGSGSQPGFGSASQSGTPFTVTRGAEPQRRSLVPIVIGALAVLVVGGAVTVFATGMVGGKATASTSRPATSAAPKTAEPEVAKPAATTDATAAATTATASATAAPTASAVASAAPPVPTAPTATARPTATAVHPVGTIKKPSAGY